MPRNVYRSWHFFIDILLYICINTLFCILLGEVQIVHFFRKGLPVKLLIPIVFAVLTGLFWGFYGPALANARAGLSSPFKPYLMIGFAYLVWGIIGGFGGMHYKGDTFVFTGAGVSWGFIAGSLGAFGALTLTLAMFTGGGSAPHIIMPTVFGTAVTIAAIVGAVQQKETPPLMMFGIAVILIGVVITASSTPHAHPPAKPATTATT